MAEAYVKDFVLNQTVSVTSEATLMFDCWGDDPTDLLVQCVAYPEVLSGSNPKFDLSIEPISRSVLGIQQEFSYRNSFRVYVTTNFPMPETGLLHIRVRAVFMPVTPPA